MATVYWPKIIPPGAYVTGQGTSVEQVIFRESFTGDGIANTFNLTGAITNASFATGSWSAARIATTAPGEINSDPGYQPIYDSIVLFIRNRINVVSISLAGLVTLDFIPRAGENFVIWYWYNLQSGDDIANDVDNTWLTTIIPDNGTTQAMCGWMIGMSLKDYIVEKLKGNIQ